jgi:trans-aconitate methyltransferase
MTLPDILAISAIVLILVFFFNFDYHARKFGVSTSHSSRIACRVILQEIENIFPRNAKIIITDPGCGSGALVRDIAHHFPNAQVSGLELSPLPYWTGRTKLALFGPRNAHILRDDFFSYSFSNSDVIVTFLPAPVLARLEQKMKDEMKPGAILLSNAFRMPEGWTPYKTLPLEKILKRQLYCYRIP